MGRQRCATADSLPFLFFLSPSPSPPPSRGWIHLFDLPQPPLRLRLNTCQLPQLPSLSPSLVLLPPGLRARYPPPSLPCFNLALPLRIGSPADVASLATLRIRRLSRRIIWSNCKPDGAILNGTWCGEIPIEAFQRWRLNSRLLIRRVGRF